MGQTKTNFLNLNTNQTNMQFFIKKSFSISVLLQIRKKEKKRQTDRHTDK
jgi:hypothetical protein